MAEGKQTLPHAIRDLAAAAIAYFDAPKVGMSHRQVAAQEPHAKTQWTVWVAGEVGI